MTEHGSGAHDKDRHTLHALGYAQELSRRMSGFSNFAISFTIISILSGTLTLYGTGINYGGPVEEAYGWPLVSLFVIIVGLGMAEIASKYPTAGGLYYWASKMGGPVWGWFTGWFNLIGQIAITAGIDYGAAVFTDALIQLLWPSTFHGTQHEVFAVYGVILFLHAVMNIFSVRLVAFLNDVSVWWHVLGVLIIVGFLVFKPARHQSFSTVFAHERGDAKRIALCGARRDHVDRRLGRLRLHPRARRVLRDPELEQDDRCGHVRSQTGVPRRARADDGEGDARDHRRRAVLLRHVVDHLGFADDVRVLAGRRDAGAQPVAAIEQAARAGVRRVGDRGARVPVRVPGVLWHERRRRVRGRDVDRDDRLYIAYAIPIYLRLREGDAWEPGEWNLGRWYKPIGRIAVVWVVFISVLFIMPTLPGGIPFKHGFTWLDVNYAIIAVVGTLLLTGGWCLLSAKKWFKGPIVQGSEEELARIEQQYEHERPAAAPGSA